MLYMSVSSIYYMLFVFPSWIMAKETSLYFISVQTSVWVIAKKKLAYYNNKCRNKYSVAMMYLKLAMENLMFIRCTIYSNI